MFLSFHVLSLLAFGSALSAFGLPQRQSFDYVLTETRMVAFSDLFQPPPPSTSSAISVQPHIQLAGDVPDSPSNAATVLFLPLSSAPVPLATASTSTFVAPSTSSVPDLPAPSSDPAPQPDPDPVSTATSTDDDDDDDFSGSSTDPIAPAVAIQTPVVTGPLVSAYYPDWVVSTLPPEKIDMTRFDWIDYAFVTPDQNFDLQWDDPSSSPGILTRLVSAAHAKGTKVKLSIGGWDGSKYFSAACATSASRQKFVNNIVTIYNKFKLDGIDIDWEYPGQAGAGNPNSPQDSANFLAMLRLLRSLLPRSARITAAVQDTPFVDATGSPMKDVSAFAGVLDWVNIMNYDVFGSSSTPGPNAPLSNACHDSSQPLENAVAAISAWSAAHFPAGRLMLGVPAYGYLNPSTATSLMDKRKRDLTSRRFLMRRQSTGGDVDDDDGTAATADTVAAASAVGNGLITLKSSDGTTNSGQIQFNAIVAQGALVSAQVSVLGNNGGAATTSALIGFGGFTRFWDACSSTPFLTSPYTKQVVTYDDPQSMSAKGAYAKQAKILGTAMWDLSGDTTQWALTNALRRALGKPT
ncbi:hypothetical protein EW145_g7877 [Phellinidium pouzarii]|uniref:GH18 domain-containing protein n=1 Tax=Phellinidium pouzarii TaxID=167371 RepID=A0A4S4KCY5_9AGAM|nr:hypothetical protein EW145_g7877 [Phellinidium pouzarii]